MRPPPRPYRPAGWPPLQDALPRYALDLTPADWQRLLDNLSDQEFWVPGRFSDGTRAWTVEVRIRGWSTRKLPKKGFSIRFPEGDPFHRGQKRIELLASWKDAGYLTEKLWYDFAAYLGLRVSDVQYVNLDLNGQYHGVMTEIERPMRSFLTRHGFDEESDLYRCGMHDCEMKDWPPEPDQYAWEKKTNESEPWNQLDALLTAINRTPEHEFAKVMDDKFEIEDLLTWLVMDALMSLPGYEDTRTYWVLDRKTLRWSLVPWDLNGALSLYNRTNNINHYPIDDSPLLSFTAYDARSYDTLTPDGRPVWSSLFTRMLDVPELRNRFAERMRLVLQDHFTEEIIGPRVDAAARLLAPHIAVDPWVDRAYAAKSAGYLRWYVRDRRAWLLAHLADLDGHGASALKLDQVGRDLAGRWYVRIKNTSTSSVSLSGLFITGELRRPRQASAPGRTLAAGESLTLSQGAADPRDELPAAMDETHPEIALFAADGQTVVDLLFLAPLDPGEAYGRSPSGTEGFGSFPATP